MQNGIEPDSSIFLILGRCSGNTTLLFCIVCIHLMIYKSQLKSKSIVNQSDELSPLRIKIGPRLSRGKFSVIRFLRGFEQKKSEKVFDFMRCNLLFQSFSSCATHQTSLFEALNTTNLNKLMNPVHFRPLTKFRNKLIAKKIWSLFLELVEKQPGLLRSSLSWKLVKSKMHRNLS